MTKKKVGQLISVSLQMMNVHYFADFNYIFACNNIIFFRFFKMRTYPQDTHRIANYVMVLEECSHLLIYQSPHKNSVVVARFTLIIEIRNHLFSFHLNHILSTN